MRPAIDVVISRSTAGSHWLGLILPGTRLLNVERGGQARQDDRLPVRLMSSAENVRTTHRSRRRALTVHST